MNENKLLINEPPLQVLPSLAKKIGLNEAIILQQIYYWLQTSKHEIEGKRWIYNSVEDWKKQFPFWGSKTISRILRVLRNKKLVIVGNYNKSKFDKTLWYAINYKQLYEEFKEATIPSDISASGAPPIYISGRCIQLRTMAYVDYLKTPEWDEKRKGALKRAKFQCQLCTKDHTELHVHHKTYKNRGAEKDEDLIVLCKDCHRKFHKEESATYREKYDNGAKRGMFDPRAKVTI